MQFQQFIIITGGVGVGKSTLVENLKKYLPPEDSLFVKEYIDLRPEQGKKLLEGILKGTGSMYELQLFIVDCFREQLKQASGKKYIIMEIHIHNIILIT